MVKKMMAVLAVLALLISLAACGGKTSTGDTKKNGGDKKASGGGPVVTADGVKFMHKPSGTPQKIFLAGSFNGWKPDDPKYALEDLDGDGVWELVIKLDPGSYQYKFVVDGTWTQDKANPKSAPDGFGGKNSVIDVK